MIVLKSSWMGTAFFSVWELGLSSRSRKWSGVWSGVSLSAGGPAVADPAPAAMLLLRLPFGIRRWRSWRCRARNENAHGTRCSITFSLTWDTTFQIAAFNHNDCYYFYFGALRSALCVLRSTKMKMIFIMPTARGECKMPDIGARCWKCSRA